MSNDDARITNDDQPKAPRPKKLMYTFGDGKQKFGNYFDAMNAAWSPDRTRIEMIKYNGIRLEWED
jgi:hypothetical protein